MSAWPTDADLQLPMHDAQSAPFVDLIVAGAGPAGIAVAQRVAAQGFRVCVVDPEPMGKWPNNYGAWVDEFQQFGLEDCMHVVWPKAKVWLDDGELGEQVLSRPFGRVDRPMLKRKLLGACLKHGVTFLAKGVEGVSHSEGSSTVRMTDGSTLQGSLVLDATGHQRRLVHYDKKFDPGFQGAYGIVAEVESHPFDLETMLFMDWRDGHTEGRPEMKAANDALPTFLYAMPFSKTKVFLEETSLVARPAIGFKDLKERLVARLEHLGIKVTRIEEEELCLIPMGGVLPQHPQRVLACGGTAGMVHPSTGFMVSRMLGSAPGIADAIVDQLSSPADKASDADLPKRPRNEAEANRMAEYVWSRIWPVERIRQRAFFTFGMDILLSLNLMQTRQFFAAFFKLDYPLWSGFLSMRLSFTQLISFGLALFISADNASRVNLLKMGVPGLVRMLVQLWPTLDVKSFYPHAGRTVRELKMAEDARMRALQQAARAELESHAKAATAAK